MFDSKNCPSGDSGPFTLPNPTPGNISTYPILEQNGWHGGFDC